MEPVRLPLPSPLRRFAVGAAVTKGVTLPSTDDSAGANEGLELSNFCVGAAVVCFGAGVLGA